MPTLVILICCFFAWELYRMVRLGVEHLPNRTPGQRVLAIAILLVWCGAVGAFVTLLLHGPF
jgi:hypothetical protein